MGDYNWHKKYIKYPNNNSVYRTDHRQARRLQTHSIGSETTELIWMKFGKYTHSLSSGR